MFEAVIGVLVDTNNQSLLSDKINAHIRSHWWHLDSWSKADTVVGTVIDGVVHSEEHISKDPEGLAILRRQVGGGDAHWTVLVSILVLL